MPFLKILVACLTAISLSTPVQGFSGALSPVSSGGPSYSYQSMAQTYYENLKLAYCTPSTRDTTTFRFLSHGSPEDTAASSTMKSHQPLFMDRSSLSFLLESTPRADRSVMAAYLNPSSVTTPPPERR